MASLPPPPAGPATGPRQPDAPPTTAPHPYSAALDRVAAALGEAKRILCITGAGMSADAGLPTYRGVGGLYAGGQTEDGIAVEDALSGQSMVERPELCWKHIATIERAARGARPSRGHQVLAELERRSAGVWVLTQNVDGLHRAAGSTRVIDIHGDFGHLVCTGCGLERFVDDYAELEIPPYCHQCGALVRPGVVLFGELLPADKVRALQHEVARGFDVVLSIGTSSLFPYVVQPVVSAVRAGRFTAEINPEATVVSDIVDVRLPLRASEALDEIARRILPTDP